MAFTTSENTPRPFNPETTSLQLPPELAVRNTPQAVPANTSKLVPPWQNALTVKLVKPVLIAEKSIKSLEKSAPLLVPTNTFPEPSTSKAYTGFAIARSVQLVPLLPVEKTLPSENPAKIVEPLTANELTLKLVIPVLEEVHVVPLSDER